MNDAKEVVAKPRRPWLAAVLTLLVPGLGQLYGGAPKRALAFMLGSIAFMVGLFLSGAVKAFSGLVIFLLALLLFFFWAVLDAINIARRKKDYVLKPYNRWYVYAALLAVMNLFVSPAVLALSPVRTFKIVSGNMEPTLRINDHLTADLQHYRTAKPMRGDLAVFTSPEDPRFQLIHRVVGLEGEQIEILDKMVYINGKPLEDPWGEHRDPQIYRMGLEQSLDESRKLQVQRDNLAAQTIPAGMVFVLEDNRDNSYDSRFYGPVPFSLLQGRLLYVYWSDEKSRIGTSLR